MAHGGGVTGVRLNGPTRLGLDRGLAVDTPHAMRDSLAVPEGQTGVPSVALVGDGSTAAWARRGLPNWLSRGQTERGLDRAWAAGQGERAWALDRVCSGSGHGGGGAGGEPRRGVARRVHGVAYGF